MIGHLGVNCADLGKAASFYDSVLGVLGHRRLMDVGVAIGYGSDQPDFWISAQPPDGPASGPNRESHVAFTAPDAATVRRCFTAAGDRGAEVLPEPRHRPEYHEGYQGPSFATRRQQRRVRVPRGPVE